MLSRIQLFAREIAFHLVWVVTATLCFYMQAHAATAQGSFVPLPLPTQNLNYDVRDLSPVYSGVISGTQTYENVPFEMRTNGSGNNALMTPIPGQSLLSDNVSATTYSIPANIYGARAVYTLINSVYDSSSGESISFVASDGTTSTVSLSFGQNVRRYTGSRSLNSTVVRNVVGTESGAHLDMQRFDLPASFATKTLTEIRFSSRGTVPSALSFAPRTGFSFLAGVTVDAGVIVDALAELIARYSMEEQVVWNGTSGELKDDGGFIGGPFNGKTIGTPVPIKSLLNPARAGASNGTCSYAQLNGPASNGGAFQLSNLPVNTSPSAQNSVSFWMYWNGSTNTSVPLGWSGYKLTFKSNIFGFDADGLMFGRSTNGLANGWHHVSAVFTNMDIASNKLYIDGVLQTLTLSGTQTQISFFNPDSVTTNISPPATWGTGSPPAGWFTDNPSRIVEVNPPSVYGASGATSTNVIEVEANPGDYNLYTTINPNPGEKLTLSVDYAARANYTSGTDSAIDIYIDNVFLSRMNTQSSVFRNFSYPLGFASGNPLKIEFRSVDKSSYGGLITNIQILRNRAVATSSLVIGGSDGDISNRFTGNLDEVKVYTGVISQAQVNTDYAATHLCLSLHHVRLDHNGSGVSCAPTQIAVRGCSNPDLNGVCTASVMAFSGTVVAERNGATVATVPFAIPAGQSFALVELNLPVAQTVSLNVFNYSTPPYGNPQLTCWDSSTNTASCQYASSDAGFIVSATANGSAVNIANQVSGVNSGSYYLRAVKKNTTTSACEAAIKGDQTINFGYVCNNPTTCSAGNLMKIGISSAGAIIEGGTFFAGNNNASGFVNSSPVTLNFDNNGNAGFWLNYYDAGQTTLFMQKSLPNGSNLTGNSNAFVTKPFNLIVSNIADSSNIVNPSANAASGAKFVKAGESFKATITAYAANNAPTRNFGKEIVPENVRFDPLLVAPTGGSAGILSGNITAAGNFNNGSATFNTLSWSEVGIVQLLPQIADSDYLGAGTVWGVTSANIGRFIPDHFNITAGSQVPGCSNQFTYFGQDGLATPFTITAKNKTNGTTVNYSGTYAANSFMKFNTTVRNSHRFTMSPTFTLDPSATPISGTWASGVGTINAKHIVRKPAARTAPASITVFAQPLDDDGVTASSALAVSTASLFRYGRMFLQSQHGSELLNLSMSLETQYWDGNGYVRNGLDSCSTVSLSNITMKNYHGNLNACETRLTGASSLTYGVQALRLSAPGVTDGTPNAGSVDLEINLNAAVPGEKVCLTGTETNATSASMPWLMDNATEPAGRATFGRNRAPVIYMHEAF